MQMSAHTSCGPIWCEAPSYSEEIVNPDGLKSIQGKCVKICIQIKFSYVKNSSSSFEGVFFCMIFCVDSDGRKENMCRGVRMLVPDHDFMFMLPTFLLNFRFS